ncbi:NinE family protein [Symbiopectobacterium purcellii]|uniref:NinE family protein n=1 Tax=Symbiopectobacterium purcellii TaxID=2871826 RepID=A0ABX9AXY3_9ENTR|nr:NinE family protein [Symbiopectobacterium purcellii]QZN97805.1 NinE family protein [Symbiopectobacterium purcellii]
MGQRVSPTYLVCERLKIQPTKRSRNKPKPIPTESEVQTFDYAYGLQKAMWDRTRSRRAR